MTTGEEGHGSHPEQMEPVDVTEKERVEEEGQKRWPNWKERQQSGSRAHAHTSGGSGGFGRRGVCNGGVPLRSEMLQKFLDPAEGKRGSRSSFSRVPYILSRYPPKMREWQSKWRECDLLAVTKTDR